MTTTILPGQGATAAPSLRKLPSTIRRASREFLYAWAVLVLAAPALCYVVLVPSLAAGLVVTVVGLMVVGWLVLAARGWGGVYRQLASSLLGVEVPSPSRWVAPSSFWRRMLAALGDPVGWRAMLFMLVSFPLSLLVSVVSSTVLVLGVGLTTQFLWSHWLPEDAVQIGGWVVNGFLSHLLVTMIGLALLVVWPMLVRVLVAPFRWLTPGLLGPSEGDRREALLRRSRDNAVSDADVRLRRLERDLHDGTQARLVAVAMHLDEAREVLASQGDRELAARLLDDAHDWTKATLIELREITQGIHPAALDTGLDVALETLASRSSVPVSVSLNADTHTRRRLPAAVESIAYYASAELLTNVVKHAGASRITLGSDLIEGDPPTLRLVVWDDGHGGARSHRSPAPSFDEDSDGHGRTGLLGLADRLATVEGSLVVDSPDGGPTMITVTIPVPKESTN